MTDHTEIKITVRYCGGCNPRYDRVALVRKIAEDFPAVVISYEAPLEGSDFVLVVCGCSVCCASHEELQGKFGKRVISSAEEYPMLFEELSELAKPAK